MQPSGPNLRMLSSRISRLTLVSSVQHVDVRKAPPSAAQVRRAAAETGDRRRPHCRQNLRHFSPSQRCPGRPECVQTFPSSGVAVPRRRSLRSSRTLSTVLSHEGVLRWRPVGEAREGSGCLPDAAGHSQRLGAEGGGDGQVGELGVKVSQVCGARLWIGWKPGSFEVSQGLRVTVREICRRYQKRRRD